MQSTAAKIVKKIIQGEESGKEFCGIVWYLEVFYGTSELRTTKNINR